MGLMFIFVRPSPPPMESRYLAEAQQRLAAAQTAKKGRRTTGHDAERPSVFRPNCVKVWTPGQLNKATNRHDPKPSFGLSSWGLKRLIEGGRLRTEPRQHPKWPPGW